MAAGNADIRFPGLSGSIDHTPHDSNLEIGLHGLQDPFYLLSHGKKVNAGATAGRAGDHLRTPFADTQAAQQFKTHPNLFHRITGQRDTKSIPYTLKEQNTQCHAGLDRTGNQAACLGNSDMEGIIGATGEFTVTGNGGQSI